MIEIVEEHACHGKTQRIVRHATANIGLPRRFGVFRPASASTRLPVPIHLAALTCTEETFAIKAGAQRYAADQELMLVTSDTSPRDTGIDGAKADRDFGAGAGFYLDATQPPWSTRFRMESYLVDELIDTLVASFDADRGRVSIFGHSMGGHGPLTLASRHPGVFRSVSAFAPIAAPTKCPWGREAFDRHLGADVARWDAHDASALMRDATRPFPGGILIDQGLADPFLEEPLQPHLFEAACRAADQPLKLRRHAGYDRGYCFIPTFVAAHLTFHADALRELSE